MSNSSDVLLFWFSEIPDEKWWDKDDAFDAQVCERYGTLHAAARVGELFEWRNTLHGRLAEIIVLDQFSRNMYRGSAPAFASDIQALCLAQEAIRNEERHKLRPDEKAFLYMPFMHSESLAIHKVARQLFSEPGLEEYRPYEEAHHGLIERFGRFPHRNAALGRVSTLEEMQYLSDHADF